MNDFQFPLANRTPPAYTRPRKQAPRREPGRCAPGECLALSVRQPWAALIASGEKTEEYRSWLTWYRGPLVIVACLAPDEEVEDYPTLPGVTLRGCTIAIVTLVDVTGSPGDYAWQLRAPVALRPVPVRGSLGLWRIPSGLVQLQEGHDDGRITRKTTTTTNPQTPGEAPTP